MKILRQSRVLIFGQHLTSRTEAVRDYLLNKVDEVYCLGVGSYSVDKKESHAFYYKNGSLVKHYLFKHRILKYIKRRELSIPVTFFTYIFDVVRALIIFRKRFDIFIGISHFPGLIGVILKTFGICKKSIYYTIDYYVPHTEIDHKNPFSGYGWFERQLLKISIWIDKVSVNNADEIWDISGRIEEGRRKFIKLEWEKYREKRKIVPLGYSKLFFRNKPINEIERNSIVFVGVTLPSQGLELIL